MEDYGNLIYLLLLVFFFIIQAIFGKKKRDQNRPQQPKRETSDGKTFDEILREMMGEEQRPSPPPVEEHRHEIPAPKTKAAQKYEVKPRQQISKGREVNLSEKKYTNVYQEYMEKNKSKLRKGIENTKPLEILELDSEASEIALNFTSDELKKAVIYKEIIDRKHFTI